MTISIFHENCLEWLSQQPDNCVAGVVSDPPYFRQGTDDLSDLLNRVMRECRRVSRGPVFWIMPLQWGFEKAHERRRWPVFNPLPDSAGYWYATTKLNTAVAPILVWGGESPGEFSIPLPEEAIQGERTTVKPVGLFTRLIKLIKPGTILDPFMGWGTCAKACKHLERDFIGVENNRAVYEAVRKELLPDSKEDKSTRDGSPGSWAKGA